MVAGEAQAAAVCGNTIGVGDWIDCQIAQSGTQPLEIDASNVAISTNLRFRSGAYLLHDGMGDVKIRLKGGSITTMARVSKGVHAVKWNSGRGDVHIDLTDIAIETSAGERSDGILGLQGPGIEGGRIDIDVTGGSITLREPPDLPSIYAASYGIIGFQRSASSDPNANIDWTTDIVVKNVVIETVHQGITGSSRSGPVFIDVTGGSIATTGETKPEEYPNVHAYGIRASRLGAPEGGISIRLDDTRVTTTGAWADGISATQRSPGTLSISLEDAQVMTTGRGAHAIRAYTFDAANDDRVFVRIAGADSVISAAGAESDAVNVRHVDLGDAVVEIADGTLISRGRRGVFARLGEPYAGQPLPGAAGQIRVVQGGTIEARTGVLAWARRGGTVSETREADDQPMIDIEWTGAFSHGTTATVAQDDTGRLLRGGTGAAVLSAARDAVAGEALRYDTAAGIDASVLSWNIMAIEAAQGDDPGVIADATAQTALLNSASAGVVARFRAALGHEEITVSNELITAIGGSAATAVADLTDTEIETYLSADNAATRTLLRRVLSRSLTDKEMAVLRALAVNVGLDAALDDPDAAFSDDYKNAVRALLERRNPGDIRIDMREGSIVSRGDGVRAYYATPHDENGAISVTIGEAATVTGAVAGVWVANAGSEGEGAARIAKQTVVVNGMVTGGEDAAVHLVGGGRLTVGASGKVIAGSSGRAVVAEGPGRAEAVIDGEVRGGAGAPAAVHLTGGGRVAVGTTGMVIANGATSAIRGDAPADDTPATVVELRVEGAVHRENAEAALRRVDGTIDGDGVDADSGVVFAATGRDGAPTGAMTPALLVDGRPVTTGLGPEFDCSAEPNPCLAIAIARSRDFGVHARYASPGDGNGAIDIAIARGATVVGVRAGVHVANAGLATLGKDTHWGRILYLEADAEDLRRQFVAVHGEVRGGLDAAVHLSGGGALWVGEGGRVIAPPGHAAVLVNDPGEALLRIDGEVRGAAGAAAAIHLTGGGRVTIGTTGRVIANGAGAAILGDRPTPDTLATTVALHVEGEVFRERARAAAARVDGAIAGAGIDRESGFVFVATDGEGAVGMTTPVPLDENGRPDIDRVRPAPTPDPDPDPGMRQPDPDPDPDPGMRQPDPDPDPDPDPGMRQPDPDPDPDPGTRPPDPDPDPGTRQPVAPGPEQPPTAPAPEPRPAAPEVFQCDLASDDRCGLYEALPRALLAMNALPTSSERMAAARGETGGWARIETDRRDWKANRSTRPDVAWDLALAGVRAGAEAAVTENIRAGVSAHGRKGAAKMARGGEIQLSAVGVGVNATATAGGVHIDAQAAVTRFDVTLTSRTGATLEDDARGTGYALALEAGVPVAVDENLTLTPRAGLSWSRVTLDGFTDSRLETPVSVEKAASLSGVAGLSVAMNPGAGRGPRLFASADAIRELSEETETMVAGVPLRTSAKPGSVRLGLGASHVWGGGRYAAQAAANYIAGGAGEGFGGGLNLSLRF